MLPAKDLWRQLSQAAWECADPGVQYDGTINEWHTSPAGMDGQLGARHNRINAPIRVLNICLSITQRVT